MAAPQALSAAQAARASTAFALLGRGDPGAALRIARELVAAAPQAPDAQQLLALARAGSGDLPGAEQAFRLALQLAPDQPALLGNLALLLRRMGRRAEALQYWQRATEVAPRQPAAWLELGLTALDLGQTAPATAALQRHVELQPGSLRGWHGLGSAQRAAGNLDAAEAALGQALALDPGRAPSWINLGGVLRLAGRPQEAVECYQRALACGPATPELLDALAGTLLDAGQPDAALALARRLVAEHPDFVPGHVALANLSWEYGPPQSSGADPLAEFRQAVRSRPGDDRLQLALASFLVEARRCEEALEHILALRQRADKPLLLALQANALELLDRPQESAPLYAQAHRIFGNSDPAFLNAYVRHLLKAGQPEQAAQRAQEVLQAEPDNQEAWAYLATAWRLLDDPREHWLCGYDHLVELLEVEVPDGYADLSAFLDVLRASLDKLHLARTEPVRQSLRSGSQTPGRLFGRPDPAIDAARTVLLRSVERWLARLPSDPSHPFLRRAARSVRFTGSWSVKLWTSGQHANHYHSEGWMSSAFYVALPPSVAAAAGGNAGHIQFGQPPLELGLGLPPRRVIRPRTGHLALFPSYLWHGTVPFHDVEPRITVAFDMLPSP